MNATTENIFVDTFPNGRRIHSLVLTDGDCVAQFAQHVTEKGLCDFVERDGYRAYFSFNDPLCPLRTQALLECYNAWPWPESV